MKVLESDFVPPCEGNLPVVESSSSQHHGVVIGPLGGVAPALLVRVPEMAPCGVSHDPLWETLPNRKGKIHLRKQAFYNKYLLNHAHINSKIFHCVEQLKCFPKAQTQT